MSIEVFGTPAPQGSKRGFVNRKTGQVNMVESSNKVKPWRQSVKFAALNAKLPTLAGPVKLEITFYLPRPKGHYRTGKHAGEVKESAPQYPATRPDTSKLGF